MIGNQKKNVGCTSQNDHLQMNYWSANYKKQIVNYCKQDQIEKFTWKM